jgi:caa(3)-type oxidase subunit IV
MSEAHDAEHADEHEKHYKKIYGILVILMIVTVVGPELGIQWLTLITAFGIAVVKAYLVCKNFMHLNVQPRYVIYMLSTALVFMLLFYAGTAGDVQKHSGDNWFKTPVPAQPATSLGDDHEGHH